MKDQPKTLTPKLRFPEFVGQAVRDVQLKDVTAESTTRNGERLPATSVMGVTKAEGIIPMEERLIAAEIARYKLVRKDWFAYNPMRLNIGSIARWQGERDILVSPDYVVFRCLDELGSEINSAYLDHFRQTEAWDNFVTEGGDGSVRVRIYYNDIARLKLALPSPAEQRKIAACLTSLDELIAAEGRKLEALRAHKKGLMQQLFPHQGESRPRLRFPKFRDAWDECSLGAMSMSISSGRDKNSPDGSFDLYGSTAVIGKASHGTFVGTFLLVARVGANAGLLTKVTGAFGVTDNTLVIDLTEKKNNDFIFHYLDNLGLNQMIFGSGQPLITSAQLKALPILLPGELERETIAACLSSLDALIAAQARKLDGLRAHKKGLMQQLFPSPEGV
jgi:type I restriction enzyme, S subunit